MTIRQSGFLKDITGTYILKDPQSELQYGIDWSDWLEAGDTVTSATWTVETTGTAIELVANDAVVLDNVALVTIRLGTAGEIYTVSNKITTAQGYIDARRFRLKVEKRFI